MGSKQRRKGIQISSNSLYKRLCCFFDSLYLSRRLSKNIVLISFYSFLLSASTQMLYSHLSLYLKYELGAGDAKIATIDGLVEFFSYFIRIFSGAISDYLGNRKLLLAIGCSISIFIKPIFAASRSIISLLSAEIIERLGAGIQSSPRDAFIADLSEENRLGESFGFAKSMKTIGAVIGTLLSVLIMCLTYNDYNILFICSAIPAVFAFFLLCKIKSQKSETIKKFQNPFRKKYLRSLDAKFFFIMFIAFVCELSHFPESLLTLKADMIISKNYAGATAAFMAIGQVLFTYPIGLLADKFEKKHIMIACLSLTIISYAILIFSCSICLFFLGVIILCGQQSSMQLLFLSIINKHINFRLRATAIGIFYFVIGTSYLISSRICGFFCETFLYDYAFLYCISVCFIAICLVVIAFLHELCYD